MHNGEISSYDANRRFLEIFGCHCALQTDTEVITYIIDYLVRRGDPGEARNHLILLVTAWTREIKELMGGMGIHSIEALRGNRLMLRGVDLTDAELCILGVPHAGG